ncbi:hypothetical protein SUGI_0809340 [Cryptomeria japonica]|nr:hypothetical protein SUGI_0809340 [Cryptomeria japonica]
MWRTNSPTGKDSPAHDSTSDSVTEMDDSLDSAWTDDKHSSYLSSIEASFVEQMYEKKYRFLDTHGQTPKQNESSDPNCAESTPNYLKPINKFKVLRKGCWLKLNYSRACHLGVSTPQTVAASPWIQHYMTAPCSKGHEVPSRTVNLSCDEHKIAAVAVPQINALESKHPFHIKTAHREFPDANEQLNVQHHSIGYKSADSYSICGRTETRHICTQELVVHPPPVSDKGVNMERNHTDMITRRQKPKIGSISCSDRDQVVPLLQSSNSADLGDCISNSNRKKSTSPNWNGKNMPVSLLVHRK